MEEFNSLPVREKAKWLYDSGQNVLRKGDHAGAHAYFTQSLNLFRGVKDKGGTARCLVALGKLIGWAGSNDFQARRPMGEEALSLFREVGDDAGIAGALEMMASIASLEEGATLLLESLKHAEIAGDRTVQASILSHLANRAQRRGEVAQAQEYVQRALQLARKGDDKAALARVLFVASTVVWKDIAVREGGFLEARSLYQELGDEASDDRALEMLASLVYPDGDARAEPYLIEALQKNRRHGSLPGIARNLMRLAAIEQTRGNLEGAATLEAESRATYVFPEPDPAFVAAIESCDPKKLQEALERMQEREKASDRNGIEEAD